LGCFCLKNEAYFAEKLIMRLFLFPQLLILFSSSLILAAEGQIKLEDLPAGGTYNSILKAPPSLSSDLNFVLPGNYGNNGDILSTDGNGLLKWVPPGAGINKIKICEIILGEYGTGSSALLEDDKVSMACGNKFGATLTITEVECFSVSGSASIMLKVSGGSDVLSSPLTCGYSFPAGNSIC
jgi:hypothetical protein